MAKISVYLNSRASRGDHSQWRDALSKGLFRHSVEFKSPLDLRNLKFELQKDVTSGVEFVVAVGGDGTMNTMIQELANTAAKLLIVPAGTANDLATEVGLNRNISQLMKLFQNRSFSTIDLIKINDYYMATNGGVGLPYLVASDINDKRDNVPGFKELMSIFGSSIYSLILGKELMKLRLKYNTYRIFSPDYHGSEKIRTPMILVNNQPCLGGDFRIAKNTSNDDGTFNVTILTHPYRMQLLKTIIDVRRGKIPTDDPYFHQFETNELIIESPTGEDIFFFGDGEVLDAQPCLKIKMQPKALNLIANINEASLSSQSYSLNDIARL